MKLMVKFLRSEGGREEENGKESWRERKERERQRRLVVRWKCLFSHFRVPSSVCVCLRSTDLVMNNLFQAGNTFCETQQSSVETLRSTDWGVLNCNCGIYCEARGMGFRRCHFYLHVSAQMHRHKLSLRKALNQMGNVLNRTSASWLVSRVCSVSSNTSQPPRHTKTFFIHSSSFYNKSNMTILH